MSWQIKCWLLLATALVAIALVATTASARLTPSLDTAALAHSRSTPTAARQPQVATGIATPSALWYRG